MSRHAAPDPAQEPAAPPEPRRTRHRAADPVDWSVAQYGPYASGANANGHAPAEVEAPYSPPAYTGPASDLPNFGTSSYDPPEPPRYERPEPPAHEQPEAPAYERPAYDRPAFGSRTPEPRTPEPPAYERPAYDPPAYEPQASERPSSEPQASERPSSEPQASEPQVSERPVYRRPAYGSQVPEPPAYQAPPVYEPPYRTPAYEPPAPYRAPEDYVGRRRAPESPTADLPAAALPPAALPPTRRPTGPGSPVGPGSPGGGRRRASEQGDPMADYLTRPTVAPGTPGPPAVPVRRPTTPIPSAARSRKAPPKEPKEPPVNRAGRLRVRVNPITCAGHGLCAELLPELFTLDDWNYPSPIVAEVPAALEGHAQRAAQQCPTLAIVLERRRPTPPQGQ